MIKYTIGTIEMKNRDFMLLIIIDHLEIYRKKEVESKNVSFLNL